MKIYQIVIHISLYLFSVVGVWAQTTNDSLAKYPKLFNVQQKYLNWIDKKDRELPMAFPVLAGNKYDGFQIGATIINLKQPVKNVDFTGVLLYGTKSRSVNGVADIAYSIYPKKQEILNQIQLHTNFKSFSLDNDPNVQKYYALKPDITFKLFSKKNPLITHLLYWQSNLIFEQVRFYNIGFNHNKDSSIKRFYANELSYSFEYKHKNFPFDLHLCFEQAKQFGKFSVELNSFIKYQLKKYHTGLHVRFFAGTFLYKNDAFRPKLNPNYGFTLSGTTGINDYKYDDFYFGRNATSGFASNQITTSNGYMKLVSPPEQNYQEGRTVNYLLSMNVVADFPIQYVPIKLFFDLGFSADKAIHTIQNLPHNRFHYDLGMMFSFFNRGLEFYIPFLVSKEIRELNRIYRPKIGNRISFMLDLQKLSLHKKIRKWNFQ